MEWTSNGSESNLEGGLVRGGRSDEVRISNIARDACWIEGEYKTSNEPGDIGDTTKFYDVGTEESDPPTFADVTIFTASMGSEGGVSLRWRTSYEVDNLGFHLYREEEGERIQVTPELVAGSALFAGPVPLTSGHSYGWWDRQGRASDQYWLEDVDLDGTRSWHGPVSPSDGSVEGESALSGPYSKSTPGETRTLSSKLLSQVGRGEPFKTVLRSSGPESGQPLAAHLSPEELQQQQWALASSSAVKLEVRERGWYRVEQSELVAAGLSAEVNPRYLQLFVQGEEQALVVRGESDESFDAVDAIEFYGTGVDTPWTDSQIYWLVEGAEPGQRASALMPPWAGTPEPTSFPFTVEQKERTIYVAAVKNGEDGNFYGPVVSSTLIQQVVDVHHADETQEAQLEVMLQGLLDVEHHVEVVLNTVRLGLVSFVAEEKKTASFTFPGSHLVKGNNTITLEALWGSADISLLEELRLTYQHTYTADADALEFTVEGSSEAGSGQLVTIEGFSNALIQVADVTDPLQTQLLDVVVQQEGTGYSTTVAVPGPGTRKLVALTEAQIKDPDTIEANGPSSWHEPGSGAEVIMIAHGDFLQSVEPLKALREAQGYSVVAMDVEDIYDEFAFGAKTPWAMRDFLELAKNEWDTQPRFVLLLGDASFDRRDYLGLGPVGLCADAAGGNGHSGDGFR